MSAGTPEATVQLTDVEQRILAFVGWRDSGRPDLLLRAMGIDADAWAAAQDRLVEIGLVTPADHVSRQ